MGLIQYLRLSTIAGAFLGGFWIPLRLIGFHPPIVLEVFFDVVVSVVAVINLYLHFRESVADYKSVRAWLTPAVLIDVACVVPLPLIAFAFFDSTPEALLLLNLSTARHVRHIRRFLDHFDSLEPMIYRLVPLLLMLPLIVHVVACGWIMLGSGTSGLDADPVLTYVKAIYWTFTTLTTVGYGDVVARTIPQMLYSCVVQVMGVGVFGYILSNVAGLLARSDAAREHHMDNLDKIETFMKQHHTPDDLRGKIRSYYHYMWVTKKGYNDDTLLEGLPAKIQSELFLHINKPMIEKVSFLRGADPELIEELMNELEERVFVPGERIFKADEPGDALYFIQNGHVDILTREGSVIATLGEGACFGEMALISNNPRTATARATVYSDCYVLHRASFEKVTSAYPEFKKNLESVMQQRRAA